MKKLFLIPLFFSLFAAGQHIRIHAVGGSSGSVPAGILDSIAAKADTSNLYRLDTTGQANGKVVYLKTTRTMAFGPDTSSGGSSGDSILVSTTAPASPKNFYFNPSDTSFNVRVLTTWYKVKGSTTTSSSGGGGTVDIAFLSNDGYTNTSQVFTVTAGGSLWGHTGVDSKYLPAATSGRIWMKYTGTDAVDAFLAFSTLNLGIRYQDIQWGFRITGGNINKDESGSLANIGSALSINDYVCLYRDGSTGVIKIQKSTNLTTWTDVGTLTGTSTAALYIVSDINGGGKMSLPGGEAIVSIPTSSGGAGTDLVFSTNTGISNTSQVLTGSGSGYGATGIDANAASSQSVRVWSKITTAATDAILGYNTANAQTGYSGMEAAVYVATPVTIPKHASKVDAGTPAGLGGQIGINTYWGVYRNGSTGDFIYQRSVDGTNWMDVATASYNSTAQIWIVCDINSTLDHPKYQLF